MSAAAAATTTSSLVMRACLFPHSLTNRKGDKMTDSSRSRTLNASTRTRDAHHHSTQARWRRSEIRLYGIQFYSPFPSSRGKSLRWSFEHSAWLWRVIFAWTNSKLSKLSAQSIKIGSVAFAPNGRLRSFVPNKLIADSACSLTISPFSLEATVVGELLDRGESLERRGWGWKTKWQSPWSHG